MRALTLLALVCALSPLRLLAQPDLETCLAAAREQAKASFEAGSSREAARRELEIAAALCFDPELSAAAAQVVGSVHAERARLARDLFAGSLTLAAYRELLQDRREKLDWLLRKPRRQRAFANGDADGDLVADRRDRCRDTPASTPTDARGCPRSPEPADPNQLGLQQEQEHALRRVLAGARFLYNPSCEGAPPPRIPAPLAWGYGSQARIFTNGINLAVSKVRGQPTGCEVFYEIQLHLTVPRGDSPTLPAAKTVTLVFSESEDLLPLSAHALFPLPYHLVWGVPPGSFTPARTEAFWALAAEYSVATWRVRAVNGANATSPWSPFVTQRTATSGVDG